MQVDVDGAANGANWVSVARLDGVQTGAVSVILDASAPQGASITVSEGWQVVGSGHCSESDTSEIFWRRDDGTLKLDHMHDTHL